MDAFGIDGKFESISQRVASTYRRMLTDFCPVIPETLTPEQQEVAIASQRDLHAFFTSLYHVLYTEPALFGLPLTEDTFAISDHGKEGINKTDVKRILDRPRKQIDEGLVLLRALAVNGRVKGDVLVVAPEDPALAYLKKKQGRAWVSGMAAAGVELVDTAGSTILRGENFPHMMPALQSLAQSSMRCKDDNLGRVFFARCDFQAIKENFKSDPVDLFRMLRPEETAWAVEQHAFFTARGYQSQVTLNCLWQWQVKYQGKRSIKGTPLFEIDFDERLLHQMRAQIKCAAASRIAPLVEKHSIALQEDFNRRTFNCLNCHWCDSRPHLGPVELTSAGETRKVCWYVPGDLNAFTVETSALVREYAELHEALG